MKSSNYIGEIATRLGVKKWMVLILTCSVIINLFLAIRITMVADKTRQIITPPQIKQSFWVDDSGVSKEYLNQMAIFFAQLNYNVTPSTVDYQHSELRKYVSPEFYSALDKELRITSNNIKSENISTWFSPQFVGTDEKSQTTILEGVFYATQGDKVVQNSQKLFEIKFGFNGGKTSILSFKDITDRNPNNVNQPQQQQQPAENIGAENPAEHKDGAK